MSMTNDAKAVEIAKRWLTNSVDENFRYFDFNDAAVLAKAFLALSEKCEKMQAVVEAARKVMTICDKPWGELEASVWSILEDNYEAYYCRDLLFEALAELEPGEADE